MALPDNPEGDARAKGAIGGEDEFAVRQRSLTEMENAATGRVSGAAEEANSSLIAEFPDRAPVVLAGIAEDNKPHKPAGRKHSHKHA